MTIPLSCVTESSYFLETNQYRKDFMMNTKFDTLPADLLDDASHAINTMMEVLGQARMEPDLIDSLAGYGVKRCSKCLSIKSLEDFHRDSSRRDGLRNKCKPCNGATVDHHRETREAHQERVEQGKREFIRETNEYTPPAPMGRLPAEVISDAGAAVEVILDKFYKGRTTPRFNDVLRAWEVKRCASCQSLQYPEDFPENKSRADGRHTECRGCNANQGARWYSENAEEIRERYRDWYVDNAESERERTSMNYHSSDGLYRMSLQLHQGYHRAIEAGNPAEKITPEDLLQHWEQQGIDPTRCYLTNEELTPQNRSIDHVQAISSGGGHVLDNLMPCTHTANTRKHNLSPEEALERLNKDKETNND